MTTVEQLTAPCTVHGEGPVWDDIADCLRFVDLLEGDVLTLRADGAIERQHVGTVAAALRPRTTGGYVVAVERGFALVDADGSVRTLPSLWEDTTVRMNDGACDPAGRFYCGSMAYDAAPGRGALWRLDPDGRAEVVLRNVTISNGLAWRPDADEALFVDSPTRRIDVLEHDRDAGTFGDSRPFVTVEAGRGMPDGIALDAEGGVWVALWEGGAVHRYGPDGELDEVLELPVRNVTACALHDGDLYITTSALDSPGEPTAGALYRSAVGIGPVPIGAFAG